MLKVGSCSRPFVCHSASAVLQLHVTTVVTFRAADYAPVQLFSNFQVKKNLVFRDIKFCTILALINVNKTYEDQIYIQNWKTMKLLNSLRGFGSNYFGRSVEVCLSYSHTTHPMTTIPAARGGSTRQKHGCLHVYISTWTSPPDC